MSAQHTVHPIIERGGWITTTLTCHAPVGAPCRLHCPEGCENWPCGHELVDYGQCVVIEWLNDSGEALEVYDGPLTPLHPGPVKLTWEGEGYIWRYVDEETN